MLDQSGQLISIIHVAKFQNSLRWSEVANSDFADLSSKFQISKFTRLDRSGPLIQVSIFTRLDRSGQLIYAFHLVELQNAIELDQSGRSVFC